MSIETELNADRRRTRSRVLFRVRNRAYSMLAQRHPEEFEAIKQELLTTWGHDPIDPDRQRRGTIVDADFPLDERVTF